VANINYKAFLNESILGGNAGLEQSRNFQALSVARPEYNARFFEAFPTMWATSYAFQKRLEAGDRTTIEEWVCLFLLHNFGIGHIAPFRKELLEAQYDKDLWPALSGTYPGMERLADVKLLRTDNGTILGACYPSVIFFPSRGRHTWTDDSLLKRYLEDSELSWAKCSERLLKDDAARAKFHLHLRRIPLEGVYFNTLHNFCQETFGQAPPTDEAQLSGDPSQWPLANGLLADEPVSPQTFLQNYPLKRKNDREGTTYYLVTGMPPTSDGWMTTSILPGLPSPSQYRKTSDGEITVEFRGERVACTLDFGDNVVLLKDCLIANPAMCGIRTEAQAMKVRNLHKLSADGRGICSSLKTGDTLAVLLAPVNDLFLKHFPEVVADPERYNMKATRSRSDDDVSWGFLIEGKEIVWHTQPEYLTELPNATVALWPPRVSPEWNLYAAYGTGARKEVCGRWVLVGEHGASNTNPELDADEYLSLLHGEKEPDRPRALLLRDSNGTAEGVLFLKLPEEPVTELRRAKLSVDFGTSNTCLAYEAGGQPASLMFKLTPEMLWGEASELETPGFVPFRWGGKDGFYPTVLLSRPGDWGAEEIRGDFKPEHLFRVDIPGLHKGIERALYLGDYNTSWNLIGDMKWDPDSRKAWRSLFLGLSMLYAHAELFFNHGAKVHEYVFTYPLAFSQDEAQLFIDDAKQTTNKIRQFCYVNGQDVGKDKFHAIDESTAVARFVEAPPNTETLELFLDTGGGTTDIALRHGSDFLVLDSIKVAGRTFFQFAQINFEREMRGGSQFKKHLGNLLQDTQDQELAIANNRLELGTFYSLAINRLDDDTFRRKEESILPGRKESGGAQSTRGMGSYSFQRYRTRLFFQHMLAYALLQACAAAVDKELDVRNGIKLVLGGNAWGLMLFGELRRSTETLEELSTEILDLIKRNLTENLPERKRPFLTNLRIADIVLLNKEKLSEAKTAVARGALTDLEASGDGQLRGSQDAQAYSGLTLSQLSVNNLTPFDLFWHDLWGMKGLKEKTGKRVGEIQSFEFTRSRDLQSPNPVLSIFTSLGNIADVEKDLLPEQEWVNINSKLQERTSYVNKDELRSAPINNFISEVLYPAKKDHRYLNVLAAKNKSFENK
jgi:hypothetical protein